MGFSLQSPAEYLPHYRCLFRVKGHAAFFNFVTEQEAQVDQLAALEAPANPPLLILTGGAALFLCVGSQDGYHQLSVCAHGVDVLLLEIDVNPQGFQLPDGFQQGHRIPRKAGDGFRDDHVDVSGTAFSQQALKPVPAVLGAGERFIGVDPAVKPTSVLLDQRTVSFCWAAEDTSKARNPWKFRAFRQKESTATLIPVVSKLRFLFGGDVGI